MSTPNGPDRGALRESRPASDAPPEAWAEYLTEILRGRPGRFAAPGVVCSLRVESPRAAVRIRESLVLEAACDLAVSLRAAGLAARVDALSDPEAGSRGPGVRLLRRALYLLSKENLWPQRRRDPEMLGSLREVLGDVHAADSLAQLLAGEIVGGAAKPSGKRPGEDRQKEIIAAIVQAGERLQRKGIRQALRQKTPGALGRELAWMTKHNKLSHTPKGYWPIGYDEPV